MLVANIDGWVIVLRFDFLIDEPYYLGAVLPTANYVEDDVPFLLECLIEAVENDLEQGCLLDFDFLLVLECENLVELFGFPFGEISSTAIPSSHDDNCHYIILMIP